MNINISYTNQAGLPTGFTTAVQAACNFFDRMFTNNITLNITFNFAAISGGLAQSQSTYFSGESYSAVTSAMKANATGVAALAGEVIPATDPFGAGGTLNVNTAECKALGIQSYSGSDGTVTLGSSFNWNYSSTGSPVAGQYSAVGALEHEISEVMGRSCGSDGSLSQTPLSLFRYSSAGVVDTSSSYANAYFSLNGGVTNLAQMGESGSDLADWGSSVSGDAFGYASAGVAENVSQTDIKELEALGYIPRKAPVMDFNGDGTSDVLLENASTGQIGAWEITNNTPTWVGFSTEASGWRVAGNGDFNGDGVSDVLLQNATTGAVGVWEIANNTPTWAYFSSEASGWHVAGVGDFNGDGVSDVLLENSTTGAIGTWEIANNTPTWAYFSSEASGWHVAGVGDFNGDGKSDVLLENATTGAIGTWEISNNTPTWAYFSSEASGWHVAGVGDFNGDGVSDVLLENSTTGAVGAWEISGNTPTWVYFSSEATGWHVTSVGDYNGDGKSDVLLSNATTGQVGEWLIANNTPTWQGLSTMSAGWHAVS